MSEAFAGEAWLIRGIPLTPRINLRFGCFGPYRSGISRLSQQLPGQQLTPGKPAQESSNANESLVAQNVSLGLESRWTGGLAFLGTTR